MTYEEYKKIKHEKSDATSSVNRVAQKTGQGTVFCLNGMVEKTRKNGFQSCGRGS